MSPKEAAEQAGVHYLTVLKWIKAGKLPAESITTASGPGYEIRAEDLEAAMSRPRGKKEPKARTAPSNSVLAEMQALRAEIERLAHEVHDLRGQLAGTEERMMKALPASTEPPRKGILERLFKRER